MKLNKFRQHMVSFLTVTMLSGMAAVPTMAKPSTDLPMDSVIPMEKGWHLTEHLIKKESFIWIPCSLCLATGMIISATATWI